MNLIRLIEQRMICKASITIPHRKLTPGHLCSIHIKNNDMYEWFDAIKYLWYCCGIQVKLSWVESDKHFEVWVSTYPSEARMIFKGGYDSQFSELVSILYEFKKLI